MNKVILSGRLTFDHKVKETSKGSVLENTIAVKRDYKNSQGQYDVDFIKIKAFSNNATFINNYINKGDSILITGKWFHSSFTGEDGNTRYSDEVILESIELLSRNNNNNNNASNTNTNSKNTTQEIDDDDLPF